MGRIFSLSNKKISIIQYTIIVCLLIFCISSTSNMAPKTIMVCPTLVNKQIPIQGQKIVVEGTSCVISTTVDDVKLYSFQPSLTPQALPDFSPRQPSSSIKENESLPPYTIVTAASANHLCALENLLYTLYDYRAQIVNFPRVVVYNLGVNQTSQLEILHQLHRNRLMDDLVTFDYNQYPSFWDISENAGEYGWKTAIVYEQSRKYGGHIVWMDAGNSVSAHFIYNVPNYIASNAGFWSPRSAYRMGRWTHPAMFSYFQEDPEEYARNINCNGAIFGLDASNKTIMSSIIIPWYQCGLDRNCIAPPGSSRKNHRQDQAALTYLSYKSGHSCRYSTRYFKLQTHRDIACRAMLLEREAQNLIYHPSTIDDSPWTPSDTFDLNSNPGWRYPQPKTSPSVQLLQLHRED